MAKRQVAKKKSAVRKPAVKPRRRPLAVLRGAVLRLLAVAIALMLGAVLFFSAVNPPLSRYMYAERERLGQIDQQWVSLDEIAPEMARSAVAAEDADFCLHWGFDTGAIRAAISEGAVRGGSTITQQVAKNLFLWQGRSWTRKALEAAITPLIEILWSKRRIIEVYLNIAEFDEGVFGVEAAARHYFDVGPDALGPGQAALLAAVLPSPKTRSALRPTPSLRRRSLDIMDGAALIRRDGRARCFED